MAERPAPSSFLLVRLGALGDIVHAIPVAARLRREFPAARIDWLVSATHRALLDLVPVVDRRLAIGGGAGRAAAPAGGTAQPGSLPPGGLVATMLELRRARYDVAFDLQGLIKSAVLARASGARRVVGFAAGYLRESLARPFYTDAYDPGGGGMYDPRECSHVVQMNLGLLTTIGVAMSAPEFPIERADSQAAHELRRRAGGQYALVNPGAAWPNKRWPPSRFAAVARKVRDRCGLVSVVSWGPGERALADEVVRESDGAVLMSPLTTLVDLVALVRGAALMIAGDTGPMHIAAAVGTPVVGLFGPTRPSRNGPWSARDVTLSRADACSCPHRRRCRRERMCLLDIEVDEVVDAVERRLAAVPEPAAWKAECAGPASRGESG